MRESLIERNLTQRVEALGGLALKFTSSRRGVPDRIILLPNGVLFFVELKAPGEEPTKQQMYVHKLLRELGQGVIVVSSLEEVDTLLAHMRRRHAI